MQRPIKLISPVYLSQGFASNPKGVDYAQFGLAGHHGVDYSAPIGQPVYAPEAGVIEFSQDGLKDKYSGRFASGQIIVLDGVSFEHWFMHLNTRVVQKGTHVSEGQLIGYSGNTGFSTGPHLHWGVRPKHPNINNGYRGFINPANVLSIQSPPPAAPTPEPTQGGLEMIKDRIAASKAYFLLRGNNSTTEAELSGSAGKRSYEEFVNTGQLEASQRADYQKGLEQHNAALSNDLIELNNQVNDLQKRPTQEKLNELQKNMNVLQSGSAQNLLELESMKKQLEVSQANEYVPTEPEKFLRTFINKIKEILGRINKK